MDKPLFFKEIDRIEEISSIQLTLLIITLVISTADVLLPSFVAQEARQDSWISVILGTISALVFINIFLTLGLKYPKKTIVQYSCDILGKGLGKIVGSLYVYFFFISTVLVIRQLEEIVDTLFFPTYIAPLFSILTIIIAAYSACEGIEVISRVNTLLLPIGLLSLNFVVFLNIPELNLNYFLPILHRGIIPPLRGALLIQTWLLNSIILLQLLPPVKDKEKIRISISIGLIVLIFGLLGGVFIISVFGPLSENFIFPALNYVRLIDFAPYIENIDIFIMVIWIIGIFINVSISFYATVLGLAHLFSLKSYKPIISPTAILVVSCSIIIARSITELMNFLKYIYPFYVFTMAVIIPVLLLSVSTIKDKIKEKR